MKNLVYCLLIFSLLACEKNDRENESMNPYQVINKQQNIVSISSLYNTSWAETAWFDFKYYDANNTLIKEVNYNGTSIDGPTYSIFIDEHFIGWWLPTGLNGPNWARYTYGTTNYEFSQEDGVMKIGDTECDLHNFTAEYIELTYTEPSDKGYCVKRVRLTPVTEQKTWDEWVAIFDTDNAAWEANQQ